jgi:hypothetical protein
LKIIHSKHRCIWQPACDAGLAALRVHREGYVDGTPKTMVFQVVEFIDAVRVERR